VIEKCSGEMKEPGYSVNLLRTHKEQITFPDCAKPLYPPPQPSLSAADHFIPVRNLQSSVPADFSLLSYHAHSFKTLKKKKTVSTYLLIITSLELPMPFQIQVLPEFALLFNTFLHQTNHQIFRI
jgi:hypothetical protein